MILSERTSPREGKPAVPLTSEDVPGKDVSDLPRYPDSVRVEYKSKEIDSLLLTQITYFSREELDTVRGFYRGVFRSEGWKVANVDFFEGEWTFLVVKGQREADIAISSHDTGTETTVQLSVPQPLRQPDKGVASEASRPEREVSPVPSPASASPPRSSVSPNEIEEDDWDDFEDD